MRIVSLSPICTNHIAEVPIEVCVNWQLAVQAIAGLMNKSSMNILLKYQIVLVNYGSAS